MISVQQWGQVLHFTESGVRSYLTPLTPRCSNCNELLHPVAKTHLQDSLPNATLSLFDDFMECVGCKKIYWRGSHYHRIRVWIDELKAN